MYRLDRMRKDYERFTGCDSYILGFHMEDMVYMVELDKLPRRYMKIQKECSKCGGGYGLYINIKSKKARTELLKKAVLVGSICDITDSKYNKGVMFEKLVYEHFGQTFRGKDSVPFTKGGDIQVNGKEIQVKYEHARVCYDKTLTKLKRANA